MTQNPGGGPLIHLAASYAACCKLGGGKKKKKKNLLLKYLLGTSFNTHAGELAERPTQLESISPLTSQCRKGKKKKATVGRW